MKVKEEKVTKIFGQEWKWYWWKQKETTFYPKQLKNVIGKLVS